MGANILCHNTKVVHLQLFCTLLVPGAVAAPISTQSRAYIFWYEKNGALKGATPPRPARG